MNIVETLNNQHLLNTPKWMADNVHYLTIVGSTAYGCNSKNSDMDVYGFCLPPKEMIFPHLNGEILGFGKQHKRFEVYQQAHIISPSTNKEYDLSIYSIVRYFQLCMENNPNMLDTLFTPLRCIQHITKIGQMVRDNRSLFIHKGCFHKFRGYAFGQRAKILTKVNSSNKERQESIQKYGMDCKYAYHLIRLLLECEQLLLSGNMDLERDREIYKSIRAGEWTFEQINEFFTKKELSLEELYNSSALPYEPDEEKIKALLLHCIEEHYGKITKNIEVSLNTSLLSELKALLEKYS